ncbi:MAG TPA: tetratricopeptide repeat protein [bacterium]|nr:tetratricopeptide repeat protein [bacterium]HPR87417.1 tetratricopeptide repeat protein [bacterium]
MGKKNRRKNKPAAIRPTKHDWRALLPWLALALLAFMLYANTLGHDFVLDDRMVITENSFTRAGLSSIPDLLSHDSLRGYLQEDTRYLTGGRYRPLSLILFAILYEFFGAQPALFHLVTVMLYAIACLLLYAVLRRMVGPPEGQPWYLTLPFVTVLLFAVHPVHTEVVANIKSCDEILALLGGLAAWYAALRYGDTPHPRWLALSGAALFLGLLSKESAIAFVAIIPLSLWMTRLPRRQVNRVMASLALAAVLFLALRYAVLGFASPQTLELLNNPFLEATAAQKWATITLTLGIYLRLLVFPHPLTYDYYPYHIALTGWSDWHVLASLLLYAGLFLFALLFLRKRNLAAFGVSFYLLALALVSNLLFPVGTFMAERFLFTPSIGFCLVLAVTGAALQRKMAHAAIAVAVLLIAMLFAAQTIARNPVWKDNYTLTTTDVRISAHSASANASAADWLIVRQAATPDPRLKKALIDSAFVYLHRAIRIHPRYGRALAMLADNSNKLRNDIDSSLYYYRRLYEINPRWPNVAYNLGTLRLDHRPAEIDSAIYWLNKATLLFPQNAGAWKNLGYAYFARQQYARAAECYLKSLQLDPRDPDTRSSALTACAAAGDTAAVRRLGSGGVH